MPMLSQSSHHTFFNGPATCPANRNAHFVMATQTVQFIGVVCSHTGSVAHLSCTAVQFDTACSAIEVVRVVHFTSEFQRLIVNQATENWKRWEYWTHNQSQIYPKCHKPNQT